jgi:hypothetical protein
LGNKKLNYLQVTNTIVEYDCQSEGDKFQIEDSEYLPISINDSVKVKSDDTSFPKLPQLETKIQDIDTTKRKYLLNIVILKEPERIEKETDHGTNKITWTLIGDKTGHMEFQEFDGNFLDKFHRNDNV